MDFIPYGRPSLDGAEEAAVLRVMRSGWLTTGGEAKKFEEEFAQFLGCNRALALNSATSGLHLALEALGVGEGDYIVTTTYTFVATAAVARHLTAHVLFCDIHPDDYNIDPVQLERVLAKARTDKKNVKAVIVVHIGGNPCRMTELLAVAKKYNVELIEDAAHAFPCRITQGNNLHSAGTLGTIGVFSFYANKTITTGEGGMIVVNPAHPQADTIFKRMVTMRSHGFNRDAFDRYTSSKAQWRYDVIAAGYKYNLPDILAAIGRVQLTKADDFLQQRSHIAQHYCRAFAGEAALILPPQNKANSWHLFSLGLNVNMLKISRDEFIEELKARNIGVSVHFIPLHLMQYWRELYTLQPNDFPESVKKFERTISLPIWQGMTEAQIKYVSDTVLDIVREFRS